MKRFKVIVTAELELPDDFELGDDPTDGYWCLKQGSNYYRPMLDWMYRRHCLDAGLLTSYETAPSVEWASVDDETGDRLFEASITKDDLTEHYQIEQL